MISGKAPDLYRRYYIEKQDERRELFRLLKDRFAPIRGLYPGSFVHITPSFFIEDMTYVDSDRRMNRFFSDDSLLPYIAAGSRYPSEPRIAHLQADFTGELPLNPEFFDILFSQYSGFISQSCRKYLKTGGILLANNSHGDSSIAAIDPGYEFIGAVTRKGDRFSLREDNLDEYFRKKNGTPIDREKVLDKMTGEGFTKPAFAYVFRKL